MRSPTNEDPGWNERLPQLNQNLDQPNHQEQPRKRKSQADPDYSLFHYEDRARPLMKSLPATDTEELKGHHTDHGVLQAGKLFSGEPPSHFPDKRRRIEMASKVPRDLSWHESQLGNEAALTAVRKLVNHWELIANTALLEHYQPGSVESTLREDHRSGVLSLLVYLGRRLRLPSHRRLGQASLSIRSTMHTSINYYVTAMEDAKKGDQPSFFDLMGELLRHHEETLTRPCRKGRRASSVVRDRLVNLIFLDSQQQQGRQISRKQCRNKIHVDQQKGK